MSTTADKEDRDRERARRAIARVCGVFGHELNNIAMLILGQSRNIEAMATDPRLGLAATRLQEVTSELRQRLEELARVAAQAGGRRQRIELVPFLETLAATLASERPERARLDLVSSPAEALAVGLDDQSFGLALEFVADHLAARGATVRLEVGRGAARDLGLGGPPGREAARLSIETRAPGVDPKLVEAADSSRSDVLLGLEDQALALALLKATARRAQGRLHTSLDQDELRIEFIAPLHIDVPGVIAAGPGTKVEAPAIRKVLIVEDDFHVRQVTTTMFGKIGFEVIAVSELGEAIEAMRETPDLALIVSDYVLPDGGNGEVLYQAAKIRPGVPLVCISGMDIATELLEQVPDIQVLRKPFTLGDIRRALVDVGVNR
ncbi:MAG: hypothetical protein H6807_09080 [Planctomycetes bacterium]|nr:hypothetical protein [Planctomycetota bacterium]